MKILIIGANSYVGARLYLDLVKEFGEDDVTGTYHSKQISKKFIKLDVTDSQNTLGTIEKIRPDIIVDVVAMASPAWCEAHPEEAMEINKNGTENILEAANKINARIIYISTTGVLNPADVYRKTKLAAEEIVKGCKSGFLIVRPGLVEGFSPNTENDRPFNRILKNLDQKTPAIYDTSWKANVTWIGHISEVVILSIRRGIKNEVVIVFSEGKRSRFDIANDILSKFGVKVEMKNDNDTSAPVQVDLSKIEELRLPTHTYEEIVSKMVDEIHHRDKFKLE